MCALPTILSRPCAVCVRGSSPGIQGVTGEPGCSSRWRNGSEAEKDISKPCSAGDSHATTWITTWITWGCKKRKQKMTMGMLEAFGWYYSSYPPFL